MKIIFECLPCLVKQSIHAAQMVTDDIELQQSIIRNTLKEMSELSFKESSPYLGRLIHKHIIEVSKNPDPYLELKNQFNDIATEISNELNLPKLIEESDSPFDTACRLSMAGNIIDFSHYTTLSKSNILDTIENCLTSNIFGNNTEELYEEIKKANKILFLADNSGEIVFDKLLIELLPKDKIAYVVKKSPIVNDAIMKDAIDTKMTELVKVIDNGSDAQGTILKLCSEEFKKEFFEADLIISKGQANYETLSECKNQNIYFLLKAKCAPVANDLGCKVGSLVLKKI